jgi:hypothetical protein
VRHFGGVTDEKREYWSKLIAEQEGSGQTIRAFCQERGVGDHCFAIGASGFNRAFQRSSLC